MTDLLETVEHETGPNPQWCVLWLHGLGADGHDFAPIVPELVRRDWPALRFVFPHAPVRAVTINGGARMRAWYDITSFDFGDAAQRADAEGVQVSVDQVNALIAREGARGIPPERILLAGFSQGGAITLAATNNGLGLAFCCVCRDSTCRRCGWCWSSASASRRACASAVA